MYVYIKKFRNGFDFVSISHYKIYFNKSSWNIKYNFPMKQGRYIFTAISNTIQAILSSSSFLNNNEYLQNIHNKIWSGRGRG